MIVITVNQEKQTSRTIVHIFYSVMNLLTMLLTTKAMKIQIVWIYGRIYLSKPRQIAQGQNPTEKNFRPWLNRSMYNPNLHNLYLGLRKCRQNLNILLKLGVVSSYSDFMTVLLKKYLSLCRRNAEANRPLHSSHQ